MTLLPKPVKKLIAKDGLGKVVEGHLAILKTTQEDELLKIVEGKIVLIENIDKVSLFKIIALGALGIITKQLIDLDFIDISEKPIEEAVLVVSEGDFKFLEKSVGKNIKINAEERSIEVYENA